MPALGAALGAAITFIGGAGGAGALGGLSGFLLRTGASVGLSLLSQALRRNRSFTPGFGEMSIESPSVGEDQPRRIIFGYTGTAGVQIGAGYVSDLEGAHGEETEGRFLVRIYALSSVPGPLGSGESNYALRDIYINGTRLRPADMGDFELSGYNHNNGTYTIDCGWTPKEGKYNELIKFWFEDGWQDTVNTYLHEGFYKHPTRPWGTDRILQNISYVVMTEIFSDENAGVYSSPPEHVFALIGKRNYDFRTGETLQRSLNPILMIREICRGIKLGNLEDDDGETWGGSYLPSELPTSVWAAAANVCDEEYFSGADPQRYLAGLEVPVTTEPAEAILELLKSCNGMIVAGIGGRLLVTAGGPALPVLSIDVSVTLGSEAARMVPYPQPDQLPNAFRARYRDPSEAYSWRPRMTDMLIDTEREKAAGKRKSVTIEMPAVYRSKQADLLVREAAEDQWPDGSPPEEISFALAGTPYDITRGSGKPLDVLDTFLYTDPTLGFDDTMFQIIDMQISYSPNWITIITARRVTALAIDPSTVRELGELPTYDAAPSRVVRVVTAPAGSTATVATSAASEYQVTPQVTLSAPRDIWAWAWTPTEAGQFDAKIFAETERLVGTGSYTVRVWYERNSVRSYRGEITFSAASGYIDVSASGDFAAGDSCKIAIEETARDAGVIQTGYSKLRISRTDRFGAVATETYSGSPVVDHEGNQVVDHNGNRVVVI